MNVAFVAALCRSYRFVFTPVIQKVMEVFNPEAVGESANHRPAQHTTTVDDFEVVRVQSIAAAAVLIVVVPLPVLAVVSYSAAVRCGLVDG